VPKAIDDKPKGTSNVSFYCPPILLEQMNKLVIDGKYQSRSECLRVSVRNFVIRELGFDRFFEERENKISEEYINSLIKRDKPKKFTIDGKEYTVIGEA